MTSEHGRKKKREKSSIWEITEDFQALERAISRPLMTPLREVGLDGWSHWPTPMNFPKRIQTLACEDGWMAEIELWGTAFAWWFWTNIIPSPIEITRKIMLGGYKCGFYSPIRIKSPLTPFIGKGGVKFLARLAAPFTRLLFYWWIASSIFAALDTWQSVEQAKDDCPEWDWACIIERGVNQPNVAGYYAGASWTVTYDPDNLYGGGSSITVPTGVVMATGYATFTPQKSALSATQIEIRLPGQPDYVIPFNAPSPDGSQHTGETFRLNLGVGGTAQLWVKVEGPFNGEQARIDFHIFAVHGLS